MKKIIIIVTSFILFSSIKTVAQNELSWTVGPELQVYPTGLLPGLRVEHFLSDKSSVNFRVALQVIDHRDLGVHDDETGNGFGFSLAYRRFLNLGYDGFSIALRTDFWSNTIDWSDDATLQSGASKIKVLQPTLLLEYTLDATSSIIITPSLGLGYEWNVSTSGSPTGQGAIVLLGISIGFQI